MSGLVLFAILIVLTFALGFVFGIYYISRKTDGDLEIDLVDMEKDIFKFEFSTPLDSIPNKKLVIFKVITKKE